MKDAIFTNNVVQHPTNEQEWVQGGAIFNTKSGQIVVNGKLDMEDNKAKVCFICRSRVPCGSSPRIIIIDFETTATFTVVVKLYASSIIIVVV